MAVSNFFNVSEEQISAVTRHVDSDESIWYEVQSQSDPDTRYKVGWNKQYNRLQCMPLTGRTCPASTQGVVCWHLRASAAVESIEQDAARSDELAARREAQAVKRDGLRAYERKPFNLLA